jgi:outer membrane lipoprotein carrier protein
LKVKIWIILALSCTIAVSAESISKIIKELQKKYEQIENLTADFNQIEQFNLTGTENVTSGKIYIAGGIKFRLETDDQTVVTDGKTVWTYSLMNNQVLIDRAKEGEGSLLPRDLLFKYPRDYYATLLEETKINNDTYYCVKLDPKEGIHGYIKTMKMWIHTKSYIISKMEYTDFNNNVSLFEIRKADTVTKLPDSLFIFVPTADMQVVDLRM